jgi:hypothetical protein
MLKTASKKNSRKVLKMQPKGVQYVRPALWLGARTMPSPCESEAKS